MNAHVTRVLIDPKTKLAYGVEFRRDGTMHRVRATREVILSGGAINSPQLLMLSGVGPKEHLRSLGIPVIHDLKVRGFREPLFTWLPRDSRSSSR